MESQGRTWADGAIINDFGEFVEPGLASLGELASLVIGPALSTPPTTAF